MDTLSVIVMLALFILLLAFIFSAGLMTPVIGRKNLLLVIFIGFLVGAVGGIFFIAPVYDEIPQIARSVYISTSDVNETIRADVSTRTDVVKLMEDVRRLDGVQGVYSEGIVIKTDSFSDKRKRIIEEKIPLIDSNITSWKVHTNGTIILKVKGNHNPVNSIETLADWLMLTGGINTRYSTVHLRVVAEPGSVDSVVEYLTARDVIVTGVEGPVEEKTQAIRDALPDKSNVVILCGLIGVLAGLAGVFIDSILGFIRRGSE